MNILFSAEMANTNKTCFHYILEPLALNAVITRNLSASWNQSKPYVSVHCNVNSFLVSIKILFMEYLPIYISLSVYLLYIYITF